MEEGFLQDVGRAEIGGVFILVEGRMSRKAATATTSTHLLLAVPSNNHSERTSDKYVAQIYKRRAAKNVGAESLR